MLIKFQVCDGYVNNGRDLYLDIDDEDLEEKTEDEKTDFIYEQIKEHHLANYGYNWGVVE